MKRVLIGLLLLALAPGCRVLSTPHRVVSTVVPASRSSSAPPNPLDLQLQLQRFADDFTYQTAAALEEYSRRLGTEAARVEALQWRLAAMHAATSIASGPNPTANLFDFVSLTTLTRMTLEDHWVKTTNGAAFEPWLAASRTLETRVWSIAAHVLKPAQVTELRDTIRDYYARQPELGRAFFSRPDFISMLKNSPKEASDPGNLLGLVGLDPTAGLDPAVREVTRTRLLAERALFTVQRMPYLMRWQTELLTFQLAEQPAAKQMLSNAERLTTSAEVFAGTARQLPQLVREQREAGIQQLLEGLAAERTNLLASLAAEEHNLRGTLAELHRTLDAGSEMATSVNGAVQSFDTLMQRFDRGTNPPPAATNARPFDILNYAKTAAEVSAAARELNGLVHSADQSLPQAGAQAERLLQRAFWLSAALLVLVLVGSLLAALAYRALAHQWGANSPVPRKGNRDES